jgi:hypothetical protein
MERYCVNLSYRTQGSEEGNMPVSFAHIAGGPLLEELLEAQRLDAAAVSYPAIETVAGALASHAQGLEAVVWPVGDAAERVAGVVTALTEGEVEVATWNSRLDGERVLLFAVSGATPLSLVAASAQVRSMGAIEVHACGVNVGGAGSAGAWESFAALALGDRHRMLQPALPTS